MGLARLHSYRGLQGHTHCPLGEKRQFSAVEAVLQRRAGKNASPDSARSRSQKKPKHKIRLLTQRWRRNLAAETVSVPGHSHVWEGFKLRNEAKTLKANCPVAEQRLGHVFRNKQLLRALLAHPSSKLVGTIISDRAHYLLAWLGDSLIYLFLTEQLIQKYPDAQQAAWNDIRRQLQARPTLAKGCEHLNLQNLIIMGSPRKSNWPTNLPGVSTKGEVFEATMGALYLDAGLWTTQHKFFRLFKLPDSVDLIDEEFSPFDYVQEQSAPKSLLESMVQDIAQALEFQETPIDFEPKKIAVATGSAYVSAEFPAEFVDVMVQNGIKLQHLGNAVIRHAVTEYLAGVKRGSSMGTLNEKRIAMHNRNTLSEVARSMGLQKFAITGPGFGEKELAMTKFSLGEIFGRLTGALYLQYGLKYASQFIIKSFIRSEPSTVFQEFPLPLGPPPQRGVPPRQLISVQ